MLREYQQRSIDELYAWLSNNKGHPCLVLPTGSGKSHIVAALCKDAVQNWPETRVLMLTHVKELIEQNAEKMRLHWPNAPMGIYSASIGKRELGEAITFAGIQSVRNRSQEIGHVDLILIDECHLFPPKDSSMLGLFMSGSKIVKVLGLTATPFRLHKDELKFITRTVPKLFGCVVHCIQVSEITSQGYWSKLLYKPVRFDDKMLKLNSSGTDYTEDSVKKAFLANDMQGTIVHAVNTMLSPGDGFIPRKSILVFVPTVEEAHQVAGKIDGAVVVWGLMSKDARDRCIDDFKDGKINVVVNVNVLSVGFDHPGVDGIIVARPTLSLAWYYQAVGRGTRIDPTKRKKDCWIYDLAGTFDRFGRVENIVIEDIQGYGWGVLGTQQQRLFTNVPMSFGVAFTRENINILPEYKRAMMMGWGWPIDKKKMYGQRTLFGGR